MRQQLHRFGSYLSTHQQVNIVNEHKYKRVILYVTKYNNGSILYQGPTQKAVKHSAEATV